MSVQLTHRSFALPDLTGLSVQLPLLVLIAGINLAFLDVAVRLHEDEAFYAQVGWNFWVHFGTGVHSFGQWGGIDRFLAAHNELAAAWTGAWPHLLGPSVFSARLSSLLAAFLCAWLVGLLAEQVLRRKLSTSHKLLLANLYLCLPVVTYTSHVTRPDLLVALVMLGSSMLVLRGLNESKDRYFLLAGFVSGVGLLVHLNLMIAPVLAVTLLLTHQDSAQPSLNTASRLLGVAQVSVGFVFGAAVYGAIHILPYLDQFFIQWHGTVVKSDGPPALLYTVPEILFKEFDRWKNFYWGYPYKRFMVIPIVFALGLYAAWRFSRPMARHASVAMATVALCLALLAGNKWPWYIAYASPWICLTMASLIWVDDRILKQAGGIALAAVFVISFVNQGAWIWRGRAANDMRHFQTVREAVKDGEKVFAGALNGYGFLDADRLLMSTWYFRFEGRARHRIGEQVSFLEHLERQGVTHVVVDRSLREFLSRSVQELPARPPIEGVEEFVRLLDGYQPVDPNDDSLSILSFEELLATSRR